MARNINYKNLNNTLQKLNNPVINLRTRSGSSNRKSKKQMNRNTNTSYIVKSLVKKIQNFEKINQRK